VDPRGEIVTARMIVVAAAWFATVAGALLVFAVRPAAFAGNSYSLGLAGLAGLATNAPRRCGARVVRSLVAGEPAVIAVTAVMAQTVLGGVTQGQTLAVAASTLLAVALFQPLRRRVRAGVDHRLNGSRYDAERTATDIAERLRDEVDVDHLHAALATTAGGTVHPDGVGVWLRPAPGAPR
jgi:hypothetical protein